ncbi:MAG: leucine--tRNA ligase [Candidatus Kuenenbacteria bacterium]
MNKYNHKKVEKKWQKYWSDNHVFEAKEDKSKEKFYGLIEFPYPSGEGLHTGHPRSYTALDIICRKRRMQGDNVLYPIGFDSFGLPAENYAIKEKINPKVVVKKNIKTFTKQLKSLGFSFDWSRSFSTTDEDYYKWTQWIFIKMFEKGLAYKTKENINWCTSCKIGLANEEVVGGACERCGGEVIKKEKEQWILKITKYADQLIKDLDKVDYLEKIKKQQIDWIGKSEGSLIKFKIQNSKFKTIKDHNYLEVFTTRPDTLFGATYMVVAPEHKLIDKMQDTINNKQEVKDYINKAKKKSDLDRTDLAKEKTGVELKGIKAINPVNNEKIPIWVADYVMMNYGTGAIMAVPAHDQRDFDFAKKYNLLIRKVVSQVNKSDCFTGDGIVINSDQFNGLTTKEFKKKIIAWLEEKGLGKRAVNYKLRDWIFSRQRYWGEPIPMVYCEKCDWIPVPEKDLPVVLPDIDDFMPTEDGDSPLAKAEDWINIKCPKCGGPAKRETDVMPNWAGSNWYFLRYCDPKNDKVLADPEKLKYWIPVDWYNGGMEHTTLHLLYSRFVYKFLYDIGAVPKQCGPEPYKKRTSHGMVLGKGGIKMSKSKGNVINPDDYVQKYGADTVRIYEMFMGPFDQAIPWDDKGVVGIYRFLNKVWKLQKKCKKQLTRNKELERIFHQTIKKVTEDIEDMKFNTAISQMMILVNQMEKNNELGIMNYELLILILSPFAPHICEELWSILGNNKSITQEKWPAYDPELVKEEEIQLVIQVNGKVRDKTTVPADISEENAKQKALESEKVHKWLEGKKPKKIIYIKGKLVSIVV